MLSAAASSNRNSREKNNDKDMLRPSSNRKGQGWTRGRMPLKKPVFDGTWWERLEKGQPEMLLKKA